MDEEQDRPLQCDFVRGASESILMFKKPKLVSLEKLIPNKTKLLDKKDENEGLEHNQISKNLKHVQTIETKLKKFDMTL